MKHKLQCLLLALLASLTASAYDFEVDGIRYNIKDSGVEVTSNSSNPYSGDIIIPHSVSYEGVTYSVTSIGSRAFEYCYDLSSITIPNSINTIGYYAFSDCYKLESVTIPTSVVLIGDHAFGSCSKLTEIVIPNSVNSIGQGAFWGCRNASSITIGRSVTSIGDLAFAETAFYKNETNWEEGVLYISNCLIKAKENVSGDYIIKNNTRVIANKAFNNNKGITSVLMPNSVTSIGDCSFENCYNLNNINLGSSVATIGNSAFYGCIALTELIIPNLVTSIGDFAFFGCQGLTSVTLSDSVETIGESAFRECFGLTAFYGKFASDDNRCLINDGTLIAYAPNGMASYIIPSEVSKIGEYVFHWVNDLKEVTIPNSVVEIGDFSFDGCGSLTSVDIGDSVTIIGRFAFNDCGNLNNVMLGDSVFTIGDGAFNGCYKLTNIKIPESVSVIGYSAFYGTGIYNEESNWENDVLYISNCLIAAKSSLSGAYTIKDNTRIIACSALGYCPNLNSVTIPNSVIRINEYAFGYCGSLTDVVIENSVTAIDDYVFCGCEQLKNVTLPYSLTSIGANAFLSCHSLISVTIPDSVTSIGENAFYDCSNLTSATIGNSINSIGGYTFGRCSSLQEIRVEKSQPDIKMGVNVFYNVPTSTCVLYVPKGSKELYAAAEQWKAFENIEEFGGEEVTPGDANGDGVVNVTDVVWIVNYVLGKGNETFKFDNADTNGDGIINVTDVVNTVNIVPASPAAKCPITPMAVADGALKVEAASLGGGETVSAVANVEAPFAATAVQFELTLPEGLALADVQAGAAHTALFRGENGRYNVVCYSATNETLDANALHLTFLADSRYRGGDIAVANAMAVEADGTEHRLASGAVETSLDAASLTPDVLYTVYTLQGTLVGTSLTAAEVRALTPGLYIVNGKKVAIK